jgi:hypothetical protein
MAVDEDYIAAGGSFGKPGTHGLVIIYLSLIQIQSVPSGCPTGEPSACPPSSVPSGCPTGEPSACPSSAPSSVPSGYPTGEPSACPSSGGGGGGSNQNHGGGGGGSGFVGRNGSAWLPGLDWGSATTYEDVIPRIDYENQCIYTSTKC